MIGIYSGTFDPPTKGHFDIIQRSRALVDKLIIAMPTESKKHKAKDVAIRQNLIKALVSGMDNVEVLPFAGLLVEFAKEKETDLIIRGLRSANDLEHEFSMASINQDLAGIETVFLYTNLEYAHISSSMVRELLSYNADISKYVPDEIHGDVLKYYA